MEFIKGAKDLPTDRYVIARFWGEVGHAIRHREKIAFRHTQGTTCWAIDHEDLQHLEWLDESGTAEANKEIERLQSEIERRNKIMEDDLKMHCRLNMPGISEQEQECAWAMFKLKNNL